MWIDEIRFNFTSASVIFPPQARGVRCSLLLGRTPLTRDYVSIDAFGMVLTRRTPLNTWRLPKPLYIAADEFLAPRFWNTSGQTHTIEIVYACRSIGSNEPRPKSIYVPWVAAYHAPSVDTPGAGFSIHQSTEADIVNPFNEPVHVQRFIGSYFAADGLSLPGQNFYNRTLVRAVDADGMVMVKDSTDFSTLFHFPTQVWGANTVLKPKGFYLFEIQRDFSDITEAETTYPIISMVGHREVVLQ
jgi:hypothetical protein